MVQDLLNIAVFQLDLIWESPAANRAKIDEWLIRLTIRPDVIFLPEMFSTGFTMRAGDFAETMEGETLSWMKKRSNEYQLALCGSLIIRDGEKCCNRLLFVPTEPMTARVIGIIGKTQGVKLVNRPAKKTVKKMKSHPLSWA